MGDSLIKERFGHSAVLNGQEMIVFGGWDGNETLNHILKYNISENTWKIIDDAKGLIKGRYRHTAVNTKKTMYVFGGIDQEQERFNDIY